MHALSGKNVMLNKLIRILSCALILLLAVSTAEAASRACVCNHGVIIEEAPQCVCQCFSKYLLPRCLYKEKDIVPMEVWLESATSDTTPISGSNIVAGLSSGFGLSPDDQTFVFQYSRHQGGYNYSSSALQTSRNSSICVVMAMVKMPGWAAQHLLADFLNNNVEGYAMQNSFTGAPYNIVMVVDAMIGPARPLLYQDESMAFYQREDGPLFVSGYNLGWAFCAFVLTMVLVNIERYFIFNVWFNVGALAYHTRRRYRVPRKNSGKGGRTTQPAGRIHSTATSTARKQVKRTPGDTRKGGKEAQRSHSHHKGRKPHLTVVCKEADTEAARQEFKRRQSQMRKKSLATAASTGVSDPKAKNPLS